MNVLVVGNVLKDVYLNLDSRTERFETDRNGTKWLDLSFNASEHSFFNRESNLGGAAVTLEVLSKLSLAATVSGSDLRSEPEGLTSNQLANTYRYILINDGKPTYLVPSKRQITPFLTPNTFHDYIYIDRSARLDQNTVQKIISYLNISPNSKLVVYLNDLDDQPDILQPLFSRASLIFYEKPNPKLEFLEENKLIHLSDNQFSYLNIKENVTTERVDILTHLSFYSIASATILGCFILGKSVEDSLKLARFNVESSRLDAALTLSELEKKLSENSSKDSDLKLIAANLVLPPKGILAADESGGSIHKKFENLSIDDTYENRRDYRNILFTTPNLDNYINGVILFDETAHQLADNGQNFVDFLTAKRIIPGIKVDQGLEKFTNSEETFTKGLDGLQTRLQEYFSLGLRFAKWRAAFNVRLDEQNHIITPTDFAIEENCRILAEYATKCQSVKLVPIVEPELVYDGNYNIDESANLTGKILDCLFTKLTENHVDLSACILKTNMVIAGKQFEIASTPSEVGIKTAETLKAHVPPELAGVVFLSGGQTPEQATDNLAAVIENGPFPWPVTFSFSRALQDPALHAWAGNNNLEITQKAFETRLRANCKALEKQDNIEQSI